MKEIWKTILGYEGLYEVSNLGNIRRIKFINNKTQINKIKKLKLNKTGKYISVILCKNGKVKGHYVHRLVAEAFIPNPNNLPQINHKDENKLNNKVDNLEWCNSFYNMNYGNVKDKISNSHKGKENLKLRKPVLQYDTNMNFIKEYNGICEAQKQTGISKDAIIKCCKNIIKTGKGYIWKYKLKEQMINDNRRTNITRD